MSVYYYYYFFYPIFLSFVGIDRQNHLESLVLSVIYNQNQMFVMKLVGLAIVLSSLVKYGFLSYQLSCQNNA